MGLAQGVTELFPISSLGQAVILPTVLGWHSLVRAQSRPESFFLAFLVGLHVATATGLWIYFWNEWRGDTGGFSRTRELGGRQRWTRRAVLRGFGRCVVTPGSDVRWGCWRVWGMRRVRAGRYRDR